MIKLLRRADGVLGALVAVVALTACTAPSAQPPAPRPSQSVRPSASSTPTPTITTAAEHQAQLFAATRAFFAAVDVGLRTGQTADLLKMTTRLCTCRAMIQFTQALAHKGRVIGAGVTVSQVKVIVDEPNLADVQLLSTYAAFVILDSSGRVVERSPRQSGRVIVALRPAPTGWLVDDLIEPPK